MFRDLSELTRKPKGFATSRRSQLNFKPHSHPSSALLYPLFRLKHHLIPKHFSSDSQLRKSSSLPARLVDLRLTGSFALIDLVDKKSFHPPDPLQIVRTQFRSSLLSIQFSFTTSGLLVILTPACEFSRLSRRLCNALLI